MSSTSGKTSIVDKVVKGYAKYWYYSALVGAVFGVFIGALMVFAGAKTALKSADEFRNILTAATVEGKPSSKLVPSDHGTEYQSTGFVVSYMVDPQDPTSEVVSAHVESFRSSEPLEDGDVITVYRSKAGGSKLSQNKENRSDGGVMVGIGFAIIALVVVGVLLRKSVYKAIVA